MVRGVKLLFPYVQLGFIGWVVWTAHAPQWQTVFVLITLGWIALGVTALRVALAAITRAFVLHDDTLKIHKKLLDSFGDRPQRIEARHKRFRL